MWLLFLGIFSCSLDEQQYRSTLLAFCWGVALQAPILIWQYCDVWFGNLGLQWFEETVFGLTTYRSAPGAFFVNANFCAEAGVIALVIAWKFNSRLWIPCAVMAFLPGSRAAFLAIGALGLLWLWKRSPRAGIAAGTCALILGSLYLAGSHDQGRFALWLNSLAMISIFGHGAGSFVSEFPLYADAAIKTPSNVYSFAMAPRTAHNDLLTLLAEHGLIGVALLSSLGRRPSSNPTDLAVLVAILVMGTVNFPLYLPHGLVIAAFCLGHAYRGRDRFVVDPDGRFSVLQGKSKRRPR